MYGIKKIAELTGISPITLRAWENRYGVICPERTEGGTRIYSEQNLTDLLWVIEQKEKNKITIKQAMTLLNTEIKQRSLQPLSRSDYQIYVQQVFEQLSQFKAHEAADLIKQLISASDEEAVFHHILAPALIEVGQHWEQETLTVAQEHFISHFIEQEMARHFYAFQLTEVKGRAIAVCPPKEMHQIGLLLFSLFLKKRNIEVTFIGENTPISSIVALIETKPIDVACFSVTISSNLPHLVELLDEIRIQHPQVELVVGGASATELPKAYQAFYLSGDLDDWEKWFQTKFNT